MERKVEYSGESASLSSGSRWGSGMPSTAKEAAYATLNIQDPNYPELLQKLNSAIGYLGEREREVVISAYHFANMLHATHKPRHTGEPYITHPVEVACILASYHVDEEVLVAALLHDVYEDHPDRVRLDDIARFYGTGVAGMCDGVTKISKVSNAHRDEIGRELEERLKKLEKAENTEVTVKERDRLIQEKKEIEKRKSKAATIHKLIVAMAKDLRTMMVKLADRIHNMRTLNGHKNPMSQKRIAQETLDIFVPIAARLGAFSIKCELADLAFRYVAPNQYEETRRRVTEILERRRECLMETMKFLRSVLQKYHIDAKLEYHVNSLYYTYRSFKRNKVYEVDHVRIIVSDDDACYRALGIVHKDSTQVNTIQDYMGTGKSNGYRALHTYIYYQSREVVPVHICSQEHVAVNDCGIFAVYADNKMFSASEVKSRFEVYQPWIKSLLDAADRADSMNEYVEYVNDLRGDLLSTDVLAFTPNGDPIDLPMGSIPLDFAYRVHTELGNTCVSAQANGVSVDLLKYEIQPNDIIKILSSHSATPRREWYDACKTQFAKNRIRAWFSKGLESLNIEAGKRIATAELTKMSLARLAGDENFLQAVALRLGRPDANALLRDLGCWQISHESFGNQVRQEVRSGYVYKKKKGSVRRGGKRTIMDMIEVVGGLPEGYKLTWMKCCSVVPGDEIVGYLANNQELRVHRLSCTAAQGLRKLYPERFVQLKWQEVGDDVVRSKVGVFVRCRVHEHIVGNIIASFDEKHEHICEYFYKEDDDGKYAEMRIYFKAASLNQLNGYIRRILEISGVENAVRM
ncbi:MAG: HD domain-containing protein [bacterium]|nr:HD domain-containing protein [bacterium]